MVCLSIDNRVGKPFENSCGRFSAVVHLSVFGPGMSVATDSKPRIPPAAEEWILILPTRLSNTSNNVLLRPL